MIAPVKICALLAAVAAIAAGASFTQAAPPVPQTTLSYSFTELGTLGGNYGLGMDVNDNAEVVGEAYLPGGSVWQRDEHAFYWANGVMSDMGTLGGTWSHANSITASGVVVGQSQIPVAGNVTHGFIWNTATRQMEDLNNYLSPADTDVTELLWASKINETHMVAGACRIRATGEQHPFLLDLNSQPAVFHDLGTVSGTNGFADAVNDAGQVVGQAGSAFLYSGTQPLINLSPLVYARDINSTGGIAGTVSGPTAVYRSPAGVVTSLASGGEAESINDSGVVVGYAADSKGRYGFRWQEGGTVQKLNSLTANLGKSSITLGRGLSPKGLIAGKSLRSGIERACLLRPQ